MLNREALRTPDRYLAPDDVRHFSSRNRQKSLVARPHDLTKELHEALGLPAPAHNRLAVAYHQLAWNDSAGNHHQIWAWDGYGERTLHEQVQFGAGLWIIGWHSEVWDDGKYLPTGPVQIGSHYRHYSGYEYPDEPTNKLDVLDVVLIEWPQDRHSQSWGRNHNAPNGWQYSNVVGVQVEFKGELVWVYVGMDNAELVFGIHVNEQGNLEMDGREFGEFPKLGSFLRRQGQGVVVTGFDFTTDDLNKLDGLHVGERSFNNLLHATAQRKNFTSTDALKKPGLTKIYKNKIKPLGDELFESREYLAWMGLRTLLKSGGRSIRKVKVSVVVNHEFADVETAEDLKKRLDPFTKGGYRDFENAIESLEYFAEKRKETVRRDTDKALRKRVADLEEIEIDKERHPLTHAALTEGEIPLTCIFPAGETYFLINDNWDLWEEMLTKFPEDTKRIAVEAGARRQYERDLMSYFYFVLYALPEYLNKHTGYNWTCSPRLVESQYELEPEAVEEDRGVIKRRSALTPVADNKKHHVVVPYCSMAVHGRMTTYCYAHSYHLLQRGMVFDGNVVTRELEEKLNGKDDYGLMFYTLTGSYTNRGYPTFLIIFERLKSKGKTRVHFHRVHPMRSKDGDRNPVSNWIKVSYNWMIGNVNKNDIAFQQGDLAFVRISEAKSEQIDWSYEQEVTDCDSHCFTMPIPFVKYEGKQKHVLGHVRIDEGGVKLEHPEHDNVVAKRGVFQVRQCRSWEANPKGIWTLNFD